MGQPGVYQALGGRDLLLRLNCYWGRIDVQRALDHSRRIAELQNHEIWKGTHVVLISGCQTGLY